MKFVEIYGKDIKPGVKCPYCVKAIDHCDKHGFRYVYRDIGNSLTRDELFRRFPDAKTVPQIFIGQTHIGGFDKLQATPIHILQQMVGE